MMTNFNKLILGTFAVVMLTTSVSATQPNIKNGLEEFGGEKKYGSIYKDSCLYVGQLQAGVPDGEGEMKSANGDVYKGFWKDGKKNGYGEQTYVTGDKYFGNWRNDRYHGYGIYSWETDGEYRGNWVDGMRHGKGTFEHPDGEVYKGDFEYNEYHGYGTCTWSDGSTYEGDWRNDLMEGGGAKTYSDGSNFVGEWCGGLPYNGKRTVKFPKGYVYEGEIGLGKLHGAGKMTNRYKQVKEGYFLDGEYVGQGPDAELRNKLHAVYYKKRIRVE